MLDFIRLAEIALHWQLRGSNQLALPVVKLR
jgi:hypothetical protein